MKISFVTTITALALAVSLVALFGRAIPARSAPPSDPKTASPGTISGQVTLEDGKPAVGYSVVARSARYVTSASASEAVTDADGHYRLTIDTSPPPMSLLMFRSLRLGSSDKQFTITVQGQEPLYLMPSEQVVTLPANLTLQNVNFRLTKAPQITIRVHDALTGQPVPGVTAQYRNTYVYSGNPDKVIGVTDAQGQMVFRVSALDVQINLVPPGGEVPTVKAAPGYPLYRQFSLPTARDVVWDVPTYPIKPPTTLCVWRGVVLTQEGHPAAYAKVSILRADDESATVTDAQGRFAATLPPLKPEDYTRGEWGIGMVAEKGDQTAALAVPVDATWTQTTIHLARKPLASYAGTVVGPDGRPESGVRVSCRGFLANMTYANINRYCMTDAWGRFQLAGLPAGLYQVNLGGSLFGVRTLPPSDPGYLYSKTSLTLRDGEQHDFGRLTVSPADEVLAGQIVDHDGKPVTSGIIAIVHGAQISKMIDLDKDGQFRAYHIVREALTLDIYRLDEHHSASLGQDSPDLFLKIPVQAGRQDVHIVLPAGALPPPADPAPPVAPTPPPPAAPVGPPQVVGWAGNQPIAGFWLFYYQENASQDPQQAVFHAALGTSPWMPGKLSGIGDPGKVWQGSLADMDGMQLSVQSNHGILQDRTGKILWAGLIQMYPNFQRAYIGITDTAKPNYLTLQGPQGQTLWSGLISSKAPPVVFVDGYVAVIGPSGKIVWQQPSTINGIGYLTLNHGRDPRRDQKPIWVGSWPPFDGVIHFTLASHRAVFRINHGHLLYSGNLPTLTLTVTGARNLARTGSINNEISSLPRILLPFSVSNSHGAFTCTLYDAHGRTIPPSTVGLGD